MISSTTRERFHDYARIFAANRFDMDQAARNLHSKFGSTFWFYMQFVNINPESSETNK
jgi:hypothetical protein